MSKKIKIMILLTVFATVSILLTNILISSAKEKLDSESTYTIVMDGQTTTCLLYTSKRDKCKNI